MLDGHSLTIADVENIAFGAKVKLHERVAKACEASREVVEQFIAHKQVAYGINTGFGRLANKHIDDEQLQKLQRNLIVSHSSGVGDYMGTEVARAMMGLRVNSLANGFSGVRIELLQALLDMLNHGIAPLIPSHGSVGASGDLAPLAHMALGLLGEGEVYYKGNVVPAAEALKAEGLEPFVLAAKEGLALINGTQFMTAVGGLALARAGRVVKAADIIGALTTEAVLGTDTSVHALLHAVRGHECQRQVASNMRRLLANSEIVASHKGCSRVQDAYSIRCLPQVHGAARTGYEFACDLVQRDMNSVTDNPVVFPVSYLEEAERGQHPFGLIMSGGNFHGAPVALALDTAAVALCYIGTISERRCDRLLAGNDGLPPFLVVNAGLNSGMMIVQYAAASLVNENKVFAHPASVDTVPTSAGQEDHNSHGPTAAHKLTSIVNNLELILACELICSCQALETRRPLRSSPPLSAAYTAVRQVVAPLEGDRSPHPDIKAARQLIASGALQKAVEDVIGPLA
ncbi:histidine ammonia-lyase [bacterium]|nr:histidine ammonia-lyase [bacterium]